jgi:outer membrane protein W
LGSTALFFAALLAPLHTLEAQDREGRWQIYPRLALVAWDNAAAIQDPVLSKGKCDYPNVGMECSSMWNNLQGGISASYFFTNALAVGLAVDVARPISNGAYFPAISMEVAGEQFLSFVNQRLTIADAMAQVEYVLSIGSLRPYLNGGVGIYAVWPEANKSDQHAVTGYESFTDLMFQIGFGIDFAVGSNTGFRIELTDQIYTGWERQNLYTTFDSNQLPDYSSTLYSDLVEAPPDEKTTLNNFRLALGFTFIPGM